MEGLFQKFRVSLFYTTIIFALGSLVSCNSQVEEEIEKRDVVFSPAFPGSSVDGDRKLRGVQKLSYAQADYSSVTLSWNYPSTYVGLDKEIFIFRVDGDAEGFSIPDPELPNSFYQPYLIDSEFEPFDGVGYIDRSINPASIYTYMIYIRSEDRWSEESRITVETNSTQEVISFPDPSTFWESITMTVGTPPSSPSSVFYNTISPGESSVGFPKGKFAVGADGNLLYFLDTDNHVVKIYTNPALAACEEFKNDEDDYFICMTIYRQMPMQAQAVLGQIDFNSRMDCHDSANPLGDKACMTSPTSVAVSDSKLYVGTSDGKILVWNNLPQYGCRHVSNLGGIETDDECEADSVIGRKTFGDYTNYDLSISGDSALFCPSDINFYQGDLYIAEACKDRVVYIRDVENSALYNCSSSAWQTPLCSFDGVLGQPDLFTHEKFEDEFDSTIFYNYSENKLDDDGQFLKKHFRNPTRIRFDLEGKMFIATNENFSFDTGLGHLELFGRVLVFEENPLNEAIQNCRSASWDFGGCDADWAIGQAGFDSLLFVPFGSNYTDLNYTFTSVDIANVANSMVASEYSSNSLLLWDNLEDEVLGIPYSSRVLNPEGADNSQTNQKLPNLGHLGHLEIEPLKGTLYSVDNVKGKLYQVDITKTLQ